MAKANAKKFGSDKPTWDEIRALRKPRTTTVWVPLDNGLMDRVEQLEKQIKAEERADERQQRRPVAPRLRKELDGLLDQAEEVAQPFEMTELPRRIYRTLLDLHPPTEADKAKGVTRWNEDGIAPTLIAAACISPELTTVPRSEFVDQIVPGAKAAKLRDLCGPAVEIWDEWSSAIAYLLFSAAYELQEGGSQVPFTVRSSSETRGSGPSSTTAPPEE